MSIPILATKLYIPPPRPKAVLRPRLIERLNESLSAGHKLTLISAPAGFGKTTLVSEWIAGCERREPEVRVSEPLVQVAWLSLDAGDNDPARFLAYLVAALQTIFAGIGAGVLAALESPQPPATDALLTVLLNEIAAIGQEFILVLDDYHLVDAKPVDQALPFLLEHQPPQMHLVIATREDPQLPLARLRARGQLTELRAADLRFTPAEAAEFLNQVMRLNLSGENIAALETRTEGWIAGLQLVALSMQGHASRDAASFIKSFTGSHRFVLDYLVEEVLGQQPESVQTFLLRTSILDRLCGPLCDAVTDDRRPTTAGERTLSAVSGPSSAVLEYLERANLFIVPLDSERRWYRYHHLFAELLRQRLQQSDRVDQYHIRASQWYEDNGLEVEAFQHAVAANDVERAERLMEGKGIPLHFRGAVNAILAWLASLPKSVLDARPLLWVRSATMALTAGQTTDVEEKLQAAEKTLANAALDAQTRDLIGQIACARATLAVTRYQPEAVIMQAHRALEHLLPSNLRFRFTANWALATGYHLRGDRVASGRALTEALAISRGSASMFSTILATTHLGRLQELENQLFRAAETFRRVLQMVGDQPGPSANDAHLGLARISYEWNDLDAAQQYAQQSRQLARQYDRVIDRYIISDVFLARLQLTRGEVAGAAAMLAEVEQTVRQSNFVQRVPEVAAAQVLTLLRQGNMAAAERLVQTHALPISQARVFLAQGDASKALAVLAPLRQQMEAKGWQDERLRVMVLEALALYMQREKDEALQLLGEALALAEPGGFIRLFVDEGEPMRLLIADFRLWIEKQTRGQGQTLLGYVDQLLAAFAPSAAMPQSKVANPESTMREPLSQRELEILKLITQGLSNREIGARLFLALDTVKGHNRRIFDKLQVQSRTEAIARARELGLL
jgi:LuxR family maltose regulon positive regulatory protein